MNCPAEHAELPEKRSPGGEILPGFIRQFKVMPGVMGSLTQWVWCCAASSSTSIQARRAAFMMDW